MVSVRRRQQARILEQCATILGAPNPVERPPFTSESRKLFFRFRRSGFVVVKKVLTKDALEVLRGKLQDRRTTRISGGNDELGWALPFSMSPKKNPTVNVLRDLNPLRETVRAILEMDSFELRSAMLLVGAPKAGRFQKWHKDMGAVHAKIPADPVAVPLPQHLAFSIPLFADTALRLVPGSHSRQPSETELEYAYRFRPLLNWASIPEARAIDPGAPANMPGSIRVRQQAGDLIVYHRHLWQASLLQPGVQRCTLHGGFFSKEASALPAKSDLQRVRTS